VQHMEYTHLLALSSFAIAGSFTPGPNNIMLMTSGANVGFYRTIPHILGIIGGYSLMLLLVGLGLMQFLQQYPLSIITTTITDIVHHLFIVFGL